ncbi:MAG: AAA family ATPase [Desulfosalsimonas sp.]
MDYFRLFNLEKEPFANTPDPEFFYRSTGHAECLQKVELAVRLRRGLSIVCGEVGTGKTTLCRQLIRTISDDPEMEAHLVLDPGYESTEGFAADVCKMTAGRQRAENCSRPGQYKETIKNYLFEAGVDRGKTIVLIIDEGQKLPPGCAEFLRELLNFETNQHKLLQIVIFAQNEIKELLRSHPGFADRAALFYQLGPLNRKDTARLIAHRLSKAGSREKAVSGPYFTRRAVSRIHRISRGYPRTIIHTAHNILVLMLIKGQNRATPSIVSQAAAGLPDVKKTPSGRMRLKTGGALAATAGILVAVMASYAYWPEISVPEQNNAGKIQESKTKEEQNTAVVSLPAVQEAAEKQEKEVPEIIGKITITEKDRLWRMLAAIYSTKNPGALFEMVQTANPHIQSPHLIRPGQEIAFPATEAAAVAESNHYWIAWKKAKDLDAVYRFAAAAKDRELRIISFWHPDSGIQHTAVEKKAFARQKQAEQKLGELANNLEKQPFLLDLSDNGYLLLTNFQNG